MDVTKHELLNPKSNLIPDLSPRKFRYVSKSLGHPTPIDDDLNPGFNEVVLPDLFDQYIQPIKDFPVYPDDIWVITYAKCGTTWMQETSWQVYNNLNFEADGKSLYDRFPFIEFSASNRDKVNPNSVEQTLALPRPRFIKSHLPIKFLPAQIWTVKPKIIYVMREPKDVAVSYFHHYGIFDRFQGTKEDFFEIFLNGEVGYGDYWNHLKQFWKLKDEPNFCFVKYEDMKHNMRKILVQLAQFLGKTLSEKDLDLLENHLDFKSMKNNSLLNLDKWMEMIKKQTGKDAAFIRRGETDSHKTEMPAEFIEKFDEKTKKELKGLNLYPTSVPKPRF